MENAKIILLFPGMSHNQLEFWYIFVGGMGSSYIVHIIPAIKSGKTKIVLQAISSKKTGLVW